MDKEQLVKEEWDKFEDFMNLLKERNSLMSSDIEKELFAIHVLNNILDQNSDKFIEIFDNQLMELAKEKLDTSELEKTLIKLSKHFE
ncbi:hypothetical protein L8R84_25455 [Vibrio splendidus]|uniref:hypothetical protein n=1 Tax=Vibrio splendidus TaxID=29497 RepID=UPI00246957CE|nr:hypothetical protein [Vibrio splendidus]MDH5939446.1 hypothetical protein [Vibrio splendidus]